MELYEYSFAVVHGEAIKSYASASEVNVKFLKNIVGFNTGEKKKVHDFSLIDHLKRGWGKNPHWDMNFCLSALIVMAVCW